MSADCSHTSQVATSIRYASWGRKWEQVHEASYCPDCRNWLRRTVMYFDGNLYKTNAEAARVSAENRARYVAERAAWVKEHYPQHATEEGS